jgi:hypothetical protein
MEQITISLQLMDPNCKPNHARAYTDPRSVEQQLQHSKKIVRLVHIEEGLLEEDYSSEWASRITPFAIPKNNNKMEQYELSQCSVLLYYPDFNTPFIFHLYTDASDHQLGAVIMQDRKLIAFYSRKFNISQKRFTTTERKQELLSAIETCNAARNTRIPCYATINRLKSLQTMRIIPSMG